MDSNFYQRIESELQALEQSGLLKPERILNIRQGSMRCVRGCRARSSWAG